MNQKNLRFFGFYEELVEDGCFRSYAFEAADLANTDAERQCLQKLELFLDFINFIGREKVYSWRWKAEGDTCYLGVIWASTALADQFDEKQFAGNVKALAAATAKSDEAFEAYLKEYDEDPVDDAHYKACMKFFALEEKYVDGKVLIIYPYSLDAFSEKEIPYLVEVMSTEKMFVMNGFLSNFRILGCTLYLCIPWDYERDSYGFNMESYMEEVRERMEEVMQKDIVFEAARAGGFQPKDCIAAFRLDEDFLTAGAVFRTYEFAIGDFVQEKFEEYTLEDTLCDHFIDHITDYDHQTSGFRIKKGTLFLCIAWNNEAAANAFDEQQFIETIKQEFSAR